MRRISASLLIVLFSASLISPALFARDDESNLPPCCRRAGKHHCAMRDMQANSSAGPSVAAAPCPMFPLASSVAVNQIVTLAGSRPPLVAGYASRAAWHPQARSVYRICYRRAGEKRGPPSRLS